MKIFKLITIIALLGLNSCVKVMDFDFSEQDFLNEDSKFKILLQEVGNYTLLDEDVLDKDPSSFNKKQKVSDSFSNSNSVANMAITKIITAATIINDSTEEEMKEKVSGYKGSQINKHSVSSSSSVLITKPNTSKKKKRFDCTHPGCDKSFTQKHNLEKHIDAIHLGVKKFDCTHPGCAKSFEQKGNLDRHFDSVHLGKRFDCTHSGCNKSFTRKGALKKHVDSVHSEGGE